MKYETVRWSNGSCELIDQTLLPGKLELRICRHHRDVVAAIKCLAVRGAPAIGVAGAYAVVLAANEASTQRDAHGYFTSACEAISLARPTAVNLTWAVEKMKSRWGQLGSSFEEASLSGLLSEAKRIHQEDLQANRSMAKFGAEVLPEGDTVITYCNTGSLATSGAGGTALGVIAEAWRQGKIKRVFVCETRPLLQGLRLTAWELEQQGIPYQVICDSMVASALRTGKVCAAVVGADRIAANGDAANKIGTYGVAVLCKEHDVPFYIAAPTSTVDMSLKTGAEIPIEERGPEEILGILGDRSPDFQMPVWNPAFDVTPNNLIRGIFCEKGALAAPYISSLKAALV